MNPTSKDAVLKIILVVGARPNFMKVAPLIRAIHKQNNALKRGRTHIDAILVHTGQHYDKMMSETFFEDLDLPEPDIFLGVGSGSHAAQTAEIMKRFEDVISAEKPDFLIVVGDVNSTLACALVASKVTYGADGRRPLIAHVEAGLRSFDRSMPEEINRILTDHLSDLLFVTEESGVTNLLREGISKGKIHFVGNAMIDTLLSYLENAERSEVLKTLGLMETPSESMRARKKDCMLPYALLTLHRPSNVDMKEAFVEILDALAEFNGSLTTVFPVHPRTRNRIREMNLDSYFNDLSHTGRLLGERINMIDPLGYIDFLSLLKNARVVLTDSGGIQEETTCLGVPCVTIRENTERPVTVSHGTNIVAGVKKGEIVKAIRDQTNGVRRRRRPKLWDGKTAERIVNILQNLNMDFTDGIVSVIETIK